ncbi:ABC transporter substrate-binding protein [Nocardia sp. NPDC024068]|uniref:ABC transporter substrate-binding protein n=1 Tax=Nocardia sp. NPDC024068 TaxID=3157197 RepID=UPI0033EF159E
MKIRPLPFLATAVILFAVSACGATGGQGTTGTGDGIPVRVQLGFIPNTQNYAIPHGIADGSYAEAGLDVTYAPGGIGVEPIKVVAAGQAEIGIANGEAIVAAQGSGMKLKILGAEFGNSPLGMLCRDDSGVETLADIAGKKIGVRPISAPGFPILLSTNHIDPGDVDVVNISNTDEASLIAGHVACTYADMALNEPRIVAEAGVPNHMLLAAEYGMAAPMNVYFTTEAYYEKHKDDVLRPWVHATQRQWAEFLADPTAAANWVLAEKPVDGLDPAQEHYQATTMVPFLQTGYTDRNGLLALDPEVWRTLAENAHAAGATDTVVDTGDLLTDLASKEIR